ncbi:MAG: hypothetical protein A3F93_02460 [Candidatus Magasanikbacteria bacterium RIFCSPLOWO2_12_FULL_34_7]|nr:MAG: hypothetical protein A3F93_02460 [Candidatus Magasanikbacteria bacterium RIFCSPLOWO2_12_FULL_34_7]
MWIDKILNKNKKIMALSPMADMTDSPFCRIVRQIGGVDIVFREMVSSEALVRGSEKTLKMAEFHKTERPIVQQIFGADPLIMARSADIVMQHSNPEGIDINMGCPVYKITSNFNGCALMKDPELASKIIKEMKSAIGDTPLSVKIRLGWSNPDDFKIFIPAIERAGVDLITVHGRTKEQGYSGVSDWQRIAEAKKIATVPLLANGAIHEPSQVSEALEITGADGVLIARGALGNPWFFDMIGKNGEMVSLDERKRVVLEHLKLHIEHYGERGIVTFRKHLSWYFKTNKIGQNLPNIKEWRSKIVQVKTLEEVESLLGELN